MFFCFVEAVLLIVLWMTLTDSYCSCNNNCLITLLNKYHVTHSNYIKLIWLKSANFKHHTRILNNNPYMSQSKSSYYSSTLCGRLLWNRARFNLHEFPDFIDLMQLDWNEKSPMASCFSVYSVHCTETEINPVY